MSNFKKNTHGAPSKALVLYHALYHIETKNASFLNNIVFSYKLTDTNCTHFWRMEEKVLFFSKFPFTNPERCAILYRRLKLNIRKYSSVGQSARFTSVRSRVRAPLFPPSKKHRIYFGAVLIFKVELGGENKRTLLRKRIFLRFERHSLFGVWPNFFL